MCDKSSRKNRLTLGQIFGPAGILECRLPTYEHRPSQQVMAEAVFSAIEHHDQLCVEAGTGTGKTLAYLIPALFSQKRVIVSTATKNLQDQIFFKDVPFIREHIFPDLEATYMKGRHNYLCLRKFQEEISQETVVHVTKQELQPVENWIKKTRTGDRAELEWMEDDNPVWTHLDARSETCTGQKCSYFDDCYVTRMRQQTLESDLIVVNHALLFANLALESDEIGRVLPDFSTLILDEAHEVEDSAATYFGKQISNYKIDEFCRDFEQVFRNSDEYFDQTNRVRSSSVAFFSSFPGLEGRSPLNFYPRGSDTVDLRLEILEQQERLTAALRTLYHNLMKQTGCPSEADPLIRRLEQLIITLEQIFDLEDTDSVYWFEKRGQGVFLHANPIDVASILQEKLFVRTDATILTSATLTTNNNFEYLKGRLGIGEAVELVVDGEFDYSKQSILYIPKAFPEPRSPHYLARALGEIKEILDITEGHAFLLFTSFLQMNRVYEALLETTHFPVFRQGEKPKTRLLELFKTTPNSVLCATSSFWQGVDVQGDALRAVIIDKLPFLVPTEPLVAARIHRLEAQGENSFLRYSVPEAIITLKQGLGRLIRSRQDRGVLVVLDSRLRTRNYGRFFLESLPECPVTDAIQDLRGFFQDR